MDHVHRYAVLFIRIRMEPITVRQRLAAGGSRGGQNLMDSQVAYQLAEFILGEGIAIASRLRGNWSKGNASHNCCPVHSAVGWPVTLKWTMRRQSPANTRNMLRTWKPRVGRPAAGGDVQEGTPSLRGRLAGAHRVFADAGLTDLNPEFEQFTVLRNGTSPVCLGSSCGSVGTSWGTVEPWFLRSGLDGPSMFRQGEALQMPGDDRLAWNDSQP